MSSQSLVLYLLIVGCEVAFWLVLLLSLVARYLLHREALSRWLLLSLPIIDMLLTVFTALDLRAGTTATVAHGLAAVYVGFTIAFGSIAVRWADTHFAYRFATGPAPPKSPTEWKAVRLDLELWVRCIGAWVIAFTLIEALVFLVGNDAVTDPLYAWHRYGFACAVCWFIFGPAWSMVFFRRETQ
jgi:hypothetical protein